MSPHSSCIVSGLNDFLAAMRRLYAAESRQNELVARLSEGGMEPKVALVLVNHVEASQKALLGVQHLFLELKVEKRREEGAELKLWLDRLELCIGDGRHPSVDDLQVVGLISELGRRQCHVLLTFHEALGSHPLVCIRSCVSNWLEIKLQAQEEIMEVYQDLYRLSRAESVAF